jgi:hypothetical protein
MNKIDRDKVMNESTLFLITDYYWYLFNAIMQDREIYSADSLIKNKSFLTALKEFGKSNNPKSAIKLFFDYGLDLRDVNIVKSDMLSDSFSSFDDVVKNHPSRIILATHNDDLKVNGRPVITSTLESVDYKDAKTGEIGTAYTLINVDSRNKELAEAQYNYQITHTQVDEKGVVSDPLNKDILPMFFALLTANGRGRESYRLVRNHMLNELGERLMSINLYYRPVKDGHKTNLDSTKVDKLLDDYQYVTSILQAFNLLDTFTKAAEIDKDEMLQYIQAIFSYELTLESMLNAYNINLDNSKKDLKTLKHI